MTEPDLTRAQFGATAGSDADRRGHWSVMRGDPNPEKHREEFERHLTYCGVCRAIEEEESR